MYIVYILGIIFLAAFLIIGGAAGLLGFAQMPLVMTLTGLLALAAGVLILISLGGGGRHTR